jgi:hypothetical protein
MLLLYIKSKCKEFDFPMKKTNREAQPKFSTELSQEKYHEKEAKINTTNFGK